jgi:Tfp pilus assembly protein PilF
MQKINFPSDLPDSFRNEINCYLKDNECQTKGALLKRLIEDTYQMPEVFEILFNPKTYKKSTFVEQITNGANSGSASKLLIN